MLNICVILISFRRLPLTYCFKTQTNPSLSVFPCFQDISSHSALSTGKGKAMMRSGQRWGKMENTVGNSRYLVALVFVKSMSHSIKQTKQHLPALSTLKMSSRCCNAMKPHLWMNPPWCQTISTDGLKARAAIYAGGWTFASGDWEKHLLSRLPLPVSSGVHMHVCERVSLHSNL